MHVVGAVALVAYGTAFGAPSVGHGFRLAARLFTEAGPEPAGGLYRGRLGGVRLGRALLRGQKHFARHAIAAIFH